MTENSAKTNLLFETFYSDNFNIDLIYPTEEDFTFVKKAKAEYTQKGYNAEAQYRPDVLALTITNRNKIVRTLVAALLLNWNDLVQAMKAAFERLGGNNAELKTIINEINANRSKISGFNSDNKKEDEPEEVQSQQQTTSTTGQSTNAGVTNMGVNKNFCRLIIYDTGYNPPARRHLYISKKVGNTYAVSVGGSQFGPSHSWYDEPLFDSLQQALNFIHNVNQTNIKTVVNTHNFKYNITDKPIDLSTWQGNKIQIADLSDAVLVDTACGPAYIQRKNKKCVESLQEKIVHLSNGDWQVQSEKGRNMGTYDTKKEAEKRLGQVEYFKHMNEEVSKDLETKVRNIIKDFSDENNSKLSILEYNDGYDGFKEKFDDKEIDFGVFTLNKLSDKEIEDGKPVITFLLSGGLNGSGDWIDYLNDTSKLFKQFEKELGLHAIVYKINTDIPDDVWTAEILLYATPKEEVKEDVEKHDKLNPKLFDNNHLKPEVREKCLEIVDLFLSLLAEDEVKIDVKDIIFTGSNASYNYTKDSDIDLHIIADTSNFECPDNLYPKLYNAYKSLFNSKFDVSFYGIPVEIYVETGDDPLISNGIYSIKNDAWEQEPIETTIPEIDWNEFMKVYQPWEDEYKELIHDLDPETATDDKPIDDFITKVYELRHTGLANEGQYGFSNLIFKELRNRGHLQYLKDLKNEIITNRLTLEALTEAANMDEKTRHILRNKIGQISHNQPIIQVNGLFQIFNVKADEVDDIIRELYRLDLVEFANKTASKYDFSKINFDSMPSRYYTISGRVKL